MRIYFNAMDKLIFYTKNWFVALGLAKTVKTWYHQIKTYKEFKKGHQIWFFLVTNILIFTFKCKRLFEIDSMRKK